MRPKQTALSRQMQQVWRLNTHIDILGFRVELKRFDRKMIASYSDKLINHQSNISCGKRHKKQFTAF